MVDIDLSDEGRKTLESLGVVMNGNVIRETYVIYENDSCYFLGIMHGTDGSINSIRLPKSHVRGVRLPAPGFVGATGSDGSHKAPTTDPSLSTSQSSK